MDSSQELYEGLVDNGLIIPVGVAGIFGRGAVFEDVLARYDDYVTRVAKDDGATKMLFPPALDRKVLEKSEFLDSFPHLAATVFSFDGNDAKHAELRDKVRAGESWHTLQAMTDVVLTPAACYPVYPSFTGTIGDEGMLIDMQNWVFRNEPSREPTRMQAFRVREFVRVGRPDVVLAWRDMWLERGLQIMKSLGLPARSDIANDPFFGRGGRMLAASQREAQLKFEVIVPVISDEKPTALCSFNWHQDHFAKIFEIRTSDGGHANTACLGFGLERVCMALFKHHGFDPATWPGIGAREIVAVMNAACALRHIDPKTYVPHALHRAERAWSESNCYIDVWIEVLSTLGCEPLACFPFILGLDWEGDQFTFFKPPLEDLFELYGVEVQELTVYKSILENAEEQLRGGKIVLSETDSFYLPDTAGTDYRTNHVKTTIGIQEIDRDARALGYFHNSSYHVLQGADFVGLFRLDVPPDPTHMPFFAELARLRRVVRLERHALVARSRSLLRKHLARRPAENPIEKFSKVFPQDVERLRSEGLAAYHIYAFATIRQLGAAFELGAIYLRWLEGFDASATAFDAISQTSKTLIMKAARAVASNKRVDLDSMIAEMASQWTFGMNALVSSVGV